MMLIIIPLFVGLINMLSMIIRAPHTLVWVPYSDHPVCLSVRLSVCPSVCQSVSPSGFFFSSITSVFLIRSLSNFTKYTIMACFNYSIITISFRAYLISILYSDWLFTLSAITLSFFTRFSSDFHLTCIHFFLLLWDIFIFIFDDGMFWKQYFQTFQSY